MNKYVFYILITVAFCMFFFASGEAEAQCAMCKAQLENNVANGTGQNTAINSGILYLMLFPYILIATIAFLFYRSYKKNKEKPAGV